MKKKSQTVWWHVTFTNDITDIKIFSVYIEGIMESIIVGFKKRKSYDDMIFLPTYY